MEKLMNKAYLYSVVGGLLWLTDKYKEVISESLAEPDNLFTVAICLVMTIILTDTIYTCYSNKK